LLDILLVAILLLALIMLAGVLLFPGSESISFFYIIGLASVVLSATSLYIRFSRRSAERPKADGMDDSLFRSLLESAPDPMIIVNEKGKIELINNQTVKLFGYAKEELLGQPVEILIPAELKSAHIAHREAYNQEPKIRAMGVGMELQAVKKSNERFPVEISLSPLSTTRGMLISASIRDITDRKKVEASLLRLNEELELRVRERTEELHDSEMRFRALVENNDGIIALLNRELNVIYRSPSTQNILGWQLSEKSGNELFNTIHADDMEHAMKTLNAALEHPGRLYNISFRTLHKDGHYIWLEGTIKNMLHDSSVRAIISNLQDVTQRKLSETALKKSEAELEQKVKERTQQLETSHREMEAFTYSVSHDLRAPLRGIVGFTTILQEEYASALDEEGKRLTSVIRHNTVKMGELIDELLRFSRLGKQELITSSIQMRPLVEEIISGIATKDRILWKLSPLPSVEGDLNTIRQVWINLLSNAVKYSAKKDRPEIEIGHQLNGKEHIFFIKDNGVGFDETYADKLFKVFQRLHGAREFEGTGVGLAIVEKIISKHGGRVWAEGMVDEGARFYFSLPVTKKHNS
jgi:PAS domain S-box-containing protein